MSDKLVWQERFNIGVDFLDKEHKKLFTIMNRLLAVSEQEGEDKSVWACQEGIKYFTNYAMKHFSEEEAYMRNIHYSEYATHKRLHDDFRNKTLPALQRELEETGYSMNAIRHFLSVCAGWLAGHTLTEDRAITGDSASKWANLLPEEEQDALVQTILHLMREMFQLDCRVISESYGGEDFGKALHVRLVYSSKTDKKWEVILCFEERLLLSAAAEVLGIKFTQINDMVVNSARYMARQFLERIRESFSGLDKHELLEEQLLTYPQLQGIFEMKKLQCSLLFDTGEGYFAFCATASDSLSSGIGRALIAENAMDEIRLYLDGMNGKQKKKILIVDDSSMMRMGMKKMLEDDYEIELSDSGASAIKNIALNRPDLILLDYEMPVCDGRQTLEMLRADEDTADIPVIFLTGRGDKESVQKVIALRPADYLLKTMKPENVKKKIDAFFEKQTS